MEREVAKIKRIIEELKNEFFERDEVIHGAFYAILSGCHTLLIGPPGTAKSQLIHRLCGKIEGAEYFQWLLTKFTTPEELFGAVSLKGLENDEYRRVINGKLPEAHIAFLDEVFKASSSILNTLLTIMNERVFYNGLEEIKIPLISLFGASNELPSDEDELDALYDRFLIRHVVDYVKEDFRFLKMLQTDEFDGEETSMTLKELILCQAKVKLINIPSHILKLLSRIRNELKKKGVVLSDRLYKQSLMVLKARAFLDGRDTVEEGDLVTLEGVLWRDPGELGEIKSVIYHILYGYRDFLRELLIQAKELESYAKREWGEEEMQINANIEAQTKLKSIISRIDLLIEEFRERGKTIEEIASVKSQVEKIQHETLSRMVSVKQGMA